MPSFAVIYMLVLAALGIASWQVSERSGLPAWLRNGDLLATAGAVLMTLAFWHEGVRDALGILAVPLFAAQLGWLLFALKPAMEFGLAMVGEGSEEARRMATWTSLALTMVVVMPALFFGWRVALAAVGV